ncbi:acetate/propionate family kinase [Piscinibacter sakaiensis]|uniref:Acetate kinase n=1 Tax=Piscinibacter sakaiensis TaxID=1547922 RepID=A0A0K8NWP0_PISS1|nr:acetate/propionate family kinase [Piscinibacter sakaiensis]GAP34360.1 acetate kinase [Piscinibacter sakaiensis]
MTTGQPLLVLNCGSSSIKFALYRCEGGDAPPREAAWRGQVQGLGSAQPQLAQAGASPQDLALDPAHPTRDALLRIVAAAREQLGGEAPAAVAHRVVHGGPAHTAPVRVDAAVLDALRRLVPLAPLHQPFAVEAMEILQAQAPQWPQVACFDTAFHHTLPLEERLLPLPWSAWERGLRRYGFHGLSYEYIATALAERHGEADAAAARTVVAHLGSGASLCALQGLRSVATTMGFSALDGLMMGSRCGALDPGAVLYLMEVEQLGLAEVADLLYHRSGLLGVSGLSADPRVLLAREADPGPDGERARAALALYVHRIVRELGGLVALLGGLDRLVFTAGVGEHSAVLRARICAALGWLGLRLDPAANEAHRPRISAADSRVDVGVEPTHEEWVAARAALRVLRG